MRRDYLQQLREYLGVARADVAALDIAVVALQIADHAARFGDEQASGGDVPGLESGLEEGIVTIQGQKRTRRCKPPALV